MIREQLLYNLWKVCNQWLSFKAAKEQGKEGRSELFMRRKGHIENLRDEALAELAEMSPKVAQLLTDYQDKKHNQGPFNVPLKGLASGYDVERQYYLNHNKQSGSSISGSKLHGKLGMATEGLAFKLKKKGFGNLSLSDAQKLERLFPNLTPVL